MTVCTNPRGAPATEASQTRSNCSPLAEPTSVGAGGEDVAALAPPPMLPVCAATPEASDTWPAAFMKYSCGAPPSPNSTLKLFEDNPGSNDEPSSLPEKDALEFCNFCQLLNCIFMISGWNGRRTLAYGF